MNLRQIFKNFVLPSFAVIALWRFYQGFSLQELIDGIKNCNLSWIILATLVHLINHLLRGYRWKVLIMLQKNYSVSTLNCFLAEMTGFFTNVAMPRIGDWTRCTTLERLNNVPIKETLPSVIVERTIDIFVFSLALTATLVASLFFKDKNVQSLFSENFQTISNASIFSFMTFVKAGLLVVLVGGGLILLYRVFKAQFQVFFDFCFGIFRSTKEVLLRINLATWLLTLLIWGSYFLVEYISCFALEATSDLGFFPIFCIFIVINLGMAIPLPANIGAYHILMSTALAAFNVPKEPAVIYVTLTHGIQVFNAMVVGGGCAFVSWLKNRRVPVERS
ncbi:MAG: lysylphosphatidylglycerol synthase transmembrane domain-containing protein [Bacteroidota bacterium]